MHNKILKPLLLSLGLILASNVRAENLVQAVYQDNFESVKSQLQSGADINKPQDMWSEQASILHFAVRLNRPEMVRLLIEEGAAVNARDGDDLTPMHIASWYGNLEMVKLLVESGADIRASSNDGRTPLSCSNNGDHYDTTSFLNSKLALSFN
jgi:ankyrin repeat protein